MRRGFTLIELMVVMVIIAMLLTIAAPRYFKHVQHARENALHQTLNVARDAIDKFHADNDVYPEVLDDLVTKRYLRQLPIDPVTESSETWIILPPPPGQRGRVYDLHSGAPGDGRDGTPYANY